jgi:hypothetical protein
VSYARRTDISQREIAETLERIGFSVRDTSRLGNGHPDLVVSWSGRVAHVEAKTPKHYDTPQQKKNQAKWREGWQGEVAVLKTAEDALAWGLVFKRQEAGR